MAATTSELNEANIPNLANVLAAMIEPFRKITPKISAVPYDYGTTGIAYNTKVITPKKPRKRARTCSPTRNTPARSAAIADMTTRVWYAALQIRPGAQRYQGHRRGLG
jgi:spermidine/putrescine transport system substrate-binding protein